MSNVPTSSTFRPGPALAPRQRKALQPVEGRVGVLRPMGEVNDTTAEIHINDRPYYLTKHDTGYYLTGYDSRKESAVVYDLPLDLSSCDCPDATFREERPGGCKHRKAIQALKTVSKL